MAGGLGFLAAPGPHPVGRRRAGRARRQRRGPGGRRRVPGRRGRGAGRRDRRRARCCSPAWSAPPARGRSASTTPAAILDGLDGVLHRARGQLRARGGPGDARAARSLHRRAVPVRRRGPPGPAVVGRRRRRPRHRPHARGRTGPRDHDRARAATTAPSDDRPSVTASLQPVQRSVTRSRSSSAPSGGLADLGQREADLEAGPADRCVEHARPCRRG